MFTTHRGIRLIIVVLALAAASTQARAQGIRTPGAPDLAAATIEDRGHAIDGHELTVAVLKVNDSASACHLLYVSASEAKRSAVLLLGAKSLSVFTVSDADRFAESGGVAQLIVENDRMRFAINLEAAHRVGVRVSSKLLSLAKIVKDGRIQP